MSEVRYFEGRPVFFTQTYPDRAGRDKGELVTRFYYFSRHRNTRCLGKALWMANDTVRAYRIRDGRSTYSNPEYEDLGIMTYNRAVQVFETMVEEIIHEEGA